MNSIVERLRSGDFTAEEILASADLIEQQAERIKELEAYTKSLETSRGELVETQAEKITEQRKRIKELEAALCEEVESRSKWYCEADKLKEELAALRQRIADAPVVAWLHEARQDSDVITNAVKHVWGGVAVGKEAKYTIPLISKEDLK